jgi:hypothetical protein
VYFGKEHKYKCVCRCIERQKTDEPTDIHTHIYISMGYIVNKKR